MSIDFVCDFAISPGDSINSFQQAYTELLSETTTVYAGDGRDDVLSLALSSGDEYQAGIQFTSSTQNLSLLHTVVVSRKGLQASARVESHCPDNTSIHRPEKPAIVNRILHVFGEAADGPFMVTDKSHLLTRKQLAYVEELLQGQSPCHLPVIYCDKEFFSEYALEDQQLSQQLAGMAHVIIEPDKYYLKKLRKTIGSHNVPTAHAVVYWPGNVASKKPVILDELCDNNDACGTIVELIRSAVIADAGQTGAAWSSLLNRLSSRGLNNDTINRNQADDKASPTGKELKKATVEDAVITRGQENAQVLLRRSDNEADFYDNEAREMVIDSIAYYLDNAQKSENNNASDRYRRSDVLKAVLDANQLSSTLVAERRDAVHRILKNKKTLDKIDLGKLNKLGIVHKDERKHHKFSLFNDRRYRWTVAKTSSDQESWKNAVSEACKRFF